ncbi:hypothetical protein BDD43_3547 [Mucilaginibacter gracilis]|uniref:NlpE-like protein n=1 Tax=Mucilaginibacter gracilis TaxID=423350 RepID=A0A495J426_9SPHI|nr:hypothetical protein [Mucilaginibacter gracilis]RKR83342.1 hypothetical protein BDD43_3547 [Mucilaginibacter gracilis]
MKKYVLIAAIAIVSLSGCGNDPIKNFISGTYVKSVSGEYSTVSDTLTVSTTGTDLHYTIARRAAYVAIRNGKKQPTKHKTETLSGVYDPQTHILQEMVKGRTLTFDPEKQTLTVGSKGIYHKIH